jgi:protein SCO1/2
MSLNRLATWTSMLLFAYSLAAANEPIISGEFDLVDQDGNQVTQSSYEGKLRLVFFGFTRCPDVCPTTLLEVARTMKLLGEHSNNVQPIFISIDPDNDTVDIIANYVRAFHPALVGLTGSHDQIARVAESFNVTYGVTASKSDASPTEVFHSSYLFVMDRQGRFLDVIGYGAKPATILAVLENYLLQ